MLQLTTSGTHTITAAFLVLSQPWLLRLTKNTFGTVVDEVADHDQHKRNRIQPTREERLSAGFRFQAKQT